MLSQQMNNQFLVRLGRFGFRHWELTMWALTVALITLPLPGHAKVPLAGQYIWSSLSAVVALVITRPVNGRVQAIVRDVTLNESGDQTVTKSALYGDLDGNRIMLHVVTSPEPSLLGNGVRTGAMITGHRTKSGILFLQINGQKVVMHPATASQCRRLLGDLRVMSHLYHALKAQETLEASLKAFIYWGRQRIADPARITAFYRYREAYYRKCLSTVRRIANRGTSSGELPCVKSIDADTYALDHERRTVLSWQFELARRAGTIEGRLEPIAVRLKHWAMLAVAASARLSFHARGRHSSIFRLDRALESGLPSSDFQSLKTYRIIVAKARISVRRCVQIVKDREPKLQAIAAEIDLVSRATSSGFHS